MEHPFRRLVDRIYIITCIKYRNTRAVKLMDTMKRLGLDDMTELIIQTCSPLDMIIKDRIRPKNSGAAQDWVVDLFMGHYHAIRTGYELGYQRIMVLEDDASILKDTEYLGKVISELPAELPVCTILDYAGSRKDYDAGLAECPYPSWGYHHWGYNGTHGYVLNRRGMDRWLTYCERTVSKGEDQTVFDATDRVWPALIEDGSPIMFPVKPLVIQASKEDPGVSGAGWLSHYREWNVDINDYTPCGGKPATVVYASDGNDFPRLEMSVFSVRKCIGQDTNIVLLSDTEKKPDIPGVTIVNPESVLSDVGFFRKGWNRRWPYATLFRLAVPLMDCFNGTDRVLYLDTDVLCRSPEGRTLFTMDLNGYEAVGAFDHASKIGRIPWLMDHDLCREARDELARRLWKPRGTRVLTYVNAGVVMWNLEAIRKNGLDWYRQRLKWFWEAECRGMFHMLDQDFVNLMVDMNSGLNKRCNWFGGDDKTDCIFQHFVTHTKGNMEPTVRTMGWNK